MPDGTTPQSSRTYAGKYQSPEALESGYNELFRLQQKTQADRKVLEERNRLLEATLTQLRTQPPAEPSYDGDNDAGVSREQLLAEARNAAIEQMQTALDPLLKGAQAVSYFGAEAPAINQFLSDTPEIQTTFQSMVGANPEGAAHYARLAYQQSLAETRESNVMAESREAAAERAASLAAGGLPPSRGQGRGAPDPNADHASRLEKAWEKAEKTGDATEYAKERLLGGPKNMAQAWWPDEPPPQSYRDAQAEGLVK